MLFGTITYYVLLTWINEKKVNVIVFGFFLLLFFRFQQFIFSFSRDSLIIMLSILFFYFLEKWHDNHSKKHLIYAITFLILAVFTKLIGILLVFCFAFFFLNKKTIKYFVLILVLLSLFTNLFVFPALMTKLSITNFLFYYWPFFLVFVFVNPSKFLWKLNLCSFFLIFLVSFKFSFLNGDWNLFWGTAYRYFALFYFPLFLWLSEETEELKSKLIKWIKS